MICLYLSNNKPSANTYLQNSSYVNTNNPTLRFEDILPFIKGCKKRKKEIIYTNIV
jgi:hypothetical protein